MRLYRRLHNNVKYRYIEILAQEILLDCDQFNLLLARIIFFYSLLRAFSFLSACVRDPASTGWDKKNGTIYCTPDNFTKY